jgi:hypothetical protein
VLREPFHCLNGAEQAALAQESISSGERLQLDLDTNQIGRIAAGHVGIHPMLVRGLFEEPE